MEPSLSNIINDETEFKFTLSDINVSLANALRRTIINDIPTIVFHTEVYEDKQCIIHTNTSRLHNEILKHRLSYYNSNLTYLFLVSNLNEGIQFRCRIQVSMKDRTKSLICLVEFSHLVLPPIYRS